MSRENRKTLFPGNHSASQRVMESYHDELLFDDDTYPVKEVGSGNHLPGMLVHLMTDNNHFSFVIHCVSFYSMSNEKPHLFE
jgi:hypothetical protein